MCSGSLSTSVPSTSKSKARSAPPPSLASASRPSAEAAPPAAAGARGASPWRMCPAGRHCARWVAAAAAVGAALAARSIGGVARAQSKGAIQQARLQKVSSDGDGVTVRKKNFELGF